MIILKRHVLVIIIFGFLLLWAGFNTSPPSAYGLAEKYKVIIAKNPFDPERGGGQIDDEDGGISTEMSEFKEKYSVYGVLIVEGQPKYAFIKSLSGRTRSRDKAEDDLRKITVGDLVDGWKVTEINSEGVAFASAGKKIFLKVFGDEKSERVSNKPVAIATPKPKIPRPPHHMPAPGLDKLRSRDQFVRPNIRPNNDNRNKEMNNPFLKALLDARKRSNGGRKPTSIKKPIMKPIPMK